MRTTMIVAAALLIACSVSAGKSDRRNGISVSADAKFDRYVSSSGKDSNEGSARRPWATLQHAAASVRPGTTVHVAPGTYGAVNTSVSGTPAAHIRFLSDAKWGALIRSLGAYSAWTNNADYIDIVGFDISGDGYIGIVNWGSGVRMIANHVHNVPATGCTRNGGAGIVNANYSGRDNEIIANVVHDIGDLSKLCARVHGIYHSNVHGRILNNISYRNQGFGIHLWHAASDVTIANNLVFNNNYGGILIGTGDAPYHDDPAHPVNNILVVNNIVVFNLNRYGIEEMGVTGDRIQYVNNIVFKNQQTDWRLKTGKQFGTINADPQFINYAPDGSGDYRLRPGSPAIGLGTSVGAPGFDIEGTARPRASGWDIGPYQFGKIPAHSWPPED